MKIIVVGDGKVGLTLTEQLSKEEHDIVVIDKNPTVLQNSQETFDVMVVPGNGASRQVLLEAGAQDADLVIAATSADEINLLCCLTAKKLGCTHTIARVRNPEYAGQLVFLKDELGLSMVINPEATAAREMFQILQFPSFLNRDRFAKGRVEIVELRSKKAVQSLESICTSCMKMQKSKSWSVLWNGENRFTFLPVTLKSRKGIKFMLLLKQGT